MQISPDELQELKSYRTSKLHLNEALAENVAVIPCSYCYLIFLVAISYAGLRWYLAYRNCNISIFKRFSFTK